MWRRRRAQSKYHTQIPGLLPKTYTRQALLETILENHSHELPPGAGFLKALTSQNTKAIFTKIQEIDETGIKTIDGEHHDFDVIVCATGFNVGFCPFFEVKGKGGASLQDQWTPNPK
jgi:cation diffusion facilitator CzcD-associated flavoprotein CzcO